MDLSQLIDEAKALARPRLEYFPGEPVDAAAWWFGVAAGKHAVAVRGDDGDWLIVGLDSRWQATLDLSGELPGGGVPLTARSGTSFPSASALFVFGSDDLKSWLRANGWDPDWGYNENFSQAALIEEYEQWWQASTPFYADEAGRPWLTTGGWVLTWPEDDEDELPTILREESRVLTLRDGEPWLEVRRAPDGKLTVWCRGT